MTKEEIAVLGHAFFDGKTLQFQFENKGWIDWTQTRCPDFGANLNEWRVKPCEPKTITICTFVSPSGHVTQAVFGSETFRNRKDGAWTHIKSLDQVVEVE